MQVPGIAVILLYHCKYETVTIAYTYTVPWFQAARIFLLLPRTGLSQRVFLHVQKEVKPSEILNKDFTKYIYQVRTHQQIISPLA